MIKLKINYNDINTINPFNYIFLNKKNIKKFQLLKIINNKKKYTNKIRIIPFHPPPIYIYISIFI